MTSLTLRAGDTPGAGGGDFRPDSAEATVHIMNEFIGSMSLGQPKK